MLLKQILYVSRCAAPVHPGALPVSIAQILQSSLRNNRRNDITGLLGYVSGAFIQVIEGPPTEIDELIDTLLMDPRHTHLTIRLEHRIDARAFAAWRMAVAPPDAPQLVFRDPFSADPARLISGLEAVSAARAELLAQENGSDSPAP